MKIEDIGPVSAERLRAAGIETTERLLEAAVTRAARQGIAEPRASTGRGCWHWVDHADLMRIVGVGSGYSDRLDAAGVDSPAELAQRNPANLAVTVQEVVAARPGIARRIPTEAEIEGWVEEAKSLPKVVEH